MSQKVYLFKIFKVSNVEHIARRPKLLYGMRLVIEVIIIKIEFDPLLKTRYRNRLLNIRDLVVIFQEVQDVFALANLRKGLNKLSS